MANKKIRRTGRTPMKKGSGKAQIFLILGLFIAILFLPTTFLLFVGMAPTIVALLVDRAKRKTKAVTIGAMNLAGAMPFVLELWFDGNSFEKSFELVMDAEHIIIMFLAAGVGYLINWSLTGIVATFLLQRGKTRVKMIEKRQKELVERWGKEVTNEVPVDEYGFAIEELDR
jgi:hypothetical protein